MNYMKISKDKSKKSMNIEGFQEKRG